MPGFAEECVRLFFQDSYRRGKNWQWVCDYTLSGLEFNLHMATDGGIDDPNNLDVRFDLRAAVKYMCAKDCNSYTTKELRQLGDELAKLSDYVKAHAVRRKEKA